MKDIAKFLGYKWDNEKSSGVQSILWRYEWEKYKSNEVKNVLLNYNIEDCYALKKVKDFISSISKCDFDHERESKEIIYQHNIETDHPFKFLKKKYANSEIENIHKYSIFDYQRQKVFVRTDKFIKKSENIKKRKKIYLRNNKVKYFSARVCVYCKSNNIKKGKRNI